MHYEFPVIEHIDQVRAAIADYPEIVIAERGPLLVVNYNVNLENTFGTVDDPLAQLRRECRGLKFCRDTGKILARPFHKFFNLNERVETGIDQMDLDHPHSILEKLDGSMIHAVQYGNQFRWCTKMGVTDVSRPVEKFVDRNYNYLQLARDLDGLNATAIFEWCSPQQRIVIDYTHDQLILTAVRDTVSGQYWNYEKLRSLGDEYNIPVVKQYLGSVSNMQWLVEHTRGLVDQEGYVVRWADGHMVKIKADQYVLLHRTKDQIRLEKNVVDILVNEGADDLKPLLDGRDREQFDQFESQFWKGLDQTCKDLEVLYRQGSHHQTRRDFAVEFVNRQPAHLRPLLYGMRDSKDVRRLVLDTIRGNTSSQTRVESARWLWGNHRWASSIYLGDN